MKQWPRRTGQAFLQPTVKGVDSVGIASVEVGRNEVAEEPGGTDAAVGRIEFELEHVAGIDGMESGSVARKEIVAAAADTDCGPYFAAATFVTFVARAAAFVAVPIVVSALVPAAAAQDAAASAARVVAVPLASASLCVVAPSVAALGAAVLDVAARDVVALDAAVPSVVAPDVAVPGVVAQGAVVPNAAVPDAFVAPTFAAPAASVAPSAAPQDVAVEAAFVARAVAALTFAVPAFAAEDAPVAVGTAVAGTVAADIAAVGAVSVVGIVAIAAEPVEVTVVETAAAGAAGSWRTWKGWPLKDWRRGDSLFAGCPNGAAGSMIAEVMEYPYRDLGPCPSRDSFPAPRVHEPWDFGSHAANFAEPSDRSYGS